MTPETEQLKPPIAGAGIEDRTSWGESVLKWTTIICASISILVMVVGILVSIYRRTRRGSLWRVNCWFCNTSTKVAYALRTSWTCPSSSCKQYNGFTKDGGYNKRLAAQYLQALNPPVIPRGMAQKPNQNKKVELDGNGLCTQCNLNQELKIFQLASFVPSSDFNFDKEIDVERTRLEKVYALCGSCTKIVEAKLEKLTNNIQKQDMTMTTTKKGWTGKALFLSSKPRQECIVNDPIDTQSRTSDSSNGTFYSTASSSDTRASSRKSMILNVSERVSTNDFDEVASLDRLSLGAPPRGNVSPPLMANLCSNCISPPQYVFGSPTSKAAASSVWREYPLVYNNSHLVFGRAVPPSVSSYGSRLGLYPAPSFYHHHPQPSLYRSSSVANIFGGKSLLAPSRLTDGFGASPSLGYGFGLHYHNYFGPPQANMYSAFGSTNQYTPHMSRSSSQSSGFVSQGLHTPSPPLALSPEGSRAPSVCSNNYLNAGNRGSIVFDSPYQGQDYEAQFHFQSAKKIENKLGRDRGNEYSRFGPNRMDHRIGSVSSVERRRSPRFAKARSVESCYSSDEEEVAQEKKVMVQQKKKRTPSPPATVTADPAKDESKAENVENSVSEGSQTSSHEVKKKSKNLRLKRLLYMIFIGASFLLNLILLTWLLFGFELPIQTGQLLLLLAKIRDFCSINYALYFEYFHQWTRIVSEGVSDFVQSRLFV